jgi:hypothetical protein
MKWKPGESGNKKGRSIEKEQRVRLAKDLLGPYVKNAVQVVADLLDSEDNADRQWAAGMVFSYVFGKPGQVVELQGKDGAPMTAVLMIGTKPQSVEH